jgi:hypothetical protein
MNPKRDMEGAIGHWSLLERSRISVDFQKTSQQCDIVKIGVHRSPESKILEAKEPSKNINPSRKNPKRHLGRNTSNIRIKSCNNAEPNLSNVC